MLGLSRRAWKFVQMLLLEQFGRHLRARVDAAKDTVITLLVITGDLVDGKRGSGPARLL